MCCLCGRGRATAGAPALRCSELRSTFSATRRSLVLDWSRRARRAMTVWRLSSGVAPSNTKTGLMLSVSSRMMRLRAGAAGAGQSAVTATRAEGSGDGWAGAHRKNPTMWAFFIMFPGGTRERAHAAARSAVSQSAESQQPPAAAQRSVRLSASAPSSSRIALTNCVIQIEASTA